MSNKLKLVFLVPAVVALLLLSPYAQVSAEEGAPQPDQTPAVEATPEQSLDPTPEPTPEFAPEPGQVCPYPNHPTVCYIPTEGGGAPADPDVCIGGEMAIVSHPGLVIGGTLIREDGCTREYWEFVEICPLVPNPDWTPPELRGYESEPDPFPQPEFIGDKDCQFKNPQAGFVLQYSEPIQP